MLIRLAKQNEFREVSNLVLQVHQIHTELRPDIYRDCNTVIDEQEYFEAIDENRLYVGIMNDKIIGAVLLLFRNINSMHQVPRKIIFIDIMVVDKKYRWIGCGTRFFEFIKELKKELGYDAIELQVNARNIDAINMYTAYGFRNKSINMELPE